MAKRRSFVIAALILAAGCSEAGPADPKMAGIGPDQFAMVIPSDAVPTSIEAAAREKCAGKSWCKVLGWTDEKSAASAMPLTDKEAASMVFSYSLNRASGLEEALWDCRRFPAAPKAECMAQ